MNQVARHIWLIWLKLNLTGWKNTQYCSNLPLILWQLLTRFTVCLHMNWERWHRVSKVYSEKFFFVPQNTRSLTHTSFHESHRNVNLLAESGAPAFPQGITALACFPTEPITYKSDPMMPDESDFLQNETAFFLGNCKIFLLKNSCFPVQRSYGLRKSYLNV